MSSADVQQPPAPAIPDYLSDPNAVLKDTAAWRYGKAPDYSNTRNVYEQTKKYKHEAGSLPSLVENLVKNWEVEASFKKELSDWRTVDHPNYTFAINGGPPQSAEHMLKVGTYNAIIASNEFYSPENSDFASSHKTFKRMMPTFAWEVVEVYSGPPRVAFKWRHWGQMKNDYVGFNECAALFICLARNITKSDEENSKGEKITAKAHNGSIDIEGVTVAQVDDQVRLQKVETWFDPLEMFRQIAPNGIVNKEVHSGTKIGENEKRSTEENNEEHDETENVSEDKITRNSDVAKDSSQEKATPAVDEAKKTIQEEAVGRTDLEAKQETSVETEKEFKQTEDNSTVHEAAPKPSEHAITTEPFAESTNSQSKNETKSSSSKDEVVTDSIADKINTTPGNALAAAPDSEETKRVHQEMSNITAAECPFLMNKE